MAETTVVNVPDGFELKPKAQPRQSTNGAARKTKLDTALTAKEKAAKELIDECLSWDDFEQSLWVLRDEGYHLRVKPVSADGKYQSGQRSLVLDQILNEVEQAQSTIYEHLSNTFGHGDYSILIYSRKNTVYIKARHPLIEFIPNPLAPPTAGHSSSAAHSGTPTAAGPAVNTQPSSQMWTAFATAAIPALVSVLEKFATRPPTTNDNTALVMKLIETSEQRTEKMIDRVESSNDVIEALERVDELRDRFSKPASAMMPPIAGAAGATNGKPAPQKDVWERALEAGLGMVAARQQQAQQIQAQQPPPAPQPTPQPAPQPEQQTQQQHEKEQLAKIEELINRNPSEMLNQIDAEITNQLKEETDIFQVLASIRDYLKFAGEHDLLEEIPELENANFDVSIALDSYLATRTYNQDYKDSIIAAASGFLPMLQKMIPQPTPQPEPVPEPETEVKIESAEDGSVSAPAAAAAI